MLCFVTEPTFDLWIALMMESVETMPPNNLKTLVYLSSASMGVWRMWQEVHYFFHQWCWTAFGVEPLLWYSKTRVFSLERGKINRQRGVMLSMGCHSPCHSLAVGGASCAASHVSGCWRSACASHALGTNLRCRNLWKTDVQLIDAQQVIGNLCVWEFHWKLWAM